MRVINFENLHILMQNHSFTIPIDNELLIGAAQSNKVLSIIPLIKRIVRNFQPVSTKLGFPTFLSCGTIVKTIYVMRYP